MSLGHGAKIVTDGLAFMFDMANGKSWKGKPTTNVVASSTDFDSQADGSTSGFLNQLSGGYLGVTSEASYGRDSKKSLKVQRGSGNRCYRTTGVAAGENLTVSAWIYSETAGSFFSLEYYGGDYSWGVGQSRVYHTGSGWEKIVTTASGPATSATTCYYFIYPSHTNPIYVDKIQVEKNSFATPYVNGTRSNTEALLDISKSNKTITTNANYTSNGSFNFTSQSHSISLSPSLNIPREKTLSIWIRSDRPLSTTDNWEIGFLNSGSTLGSMFGFMYGVGNCQDLGYWGYGSAYDLSVESATNKWSSDGNWHNAVITMDSSRNVRVWVDGEQKQWLLHSDYSTKVDSVAMPVDTTNNFVINSRGSWNSGMTYVDLGVVMVYEKALTDEEIKQNFEAHRARYGI